MKNHSLTTSATNTDLPNSPSSSLINHNLSIIPPSFNSFNHGPSIASLIREKRKQLSLAQNNNSSTTTITSPLTSPIESKTIPSSSQPTSLERKPRSRGNTRIPALTDQLLMTTRFDTLKPLKHSLSQPQPSESTSLTRLPPTSFSNLLSNPCHHPLSGPLDPSLAEVVMTPTTQEWWAFGGIPHKPKKYSTKSSLGGTTSVASVTTTTTTKNNQHEEEEDQDDEQEEEEEEEEDDRSDHTGDSSSNDSDQCPPSSTTHSPKPEPSSSVSTPDSSLEASNHSHTSSPTWTATKFCPEINSSVAPNSPKNFISPLSSPLEFSAGLISTEAEPTLALTTLTSVNGIFNVPSSPVGDTFHSHLAQTHHTLPTLTAMSSYSLGSSTEPLTSTALLSSLLDKAPQSATSRPCTLAHDGVVRKSIDPRSYSAMTGHRNLDSFVIHSSAGSGAYGIVKHAQEKGADGKPVGPPLVIKYIIKQRILADCWKRHKVLGPIPVEIHVLDHLRRVSYRPSLIALAMQYSENRQSDGDSAPLHTIPNRSDLIQLYAKEVAPGNYGSSQAHQRTGHPNICGILDYFEDSDYYYMVMPQFGDGKDLFGYIESSPDGLPTDEVRRIFGQIVDGVAFLHERNIVHRDLKDENVILDRDGNAQLIDFGSAAYVKEGSKFETFSGTLDFAAPEVLMGIPHGGKEIDIWALGVILFVLITGECPFWNPDEAAKGIGEGSRARAKLEEHLKKNCRTKTNPSLEESCEEDHDNDERQSVLDLLKHCLNLEAKLRPSIEHICWHKFFLPSGGWSGQSIPSISEPSLPLPPSSVL